MKKGFIFLLIFTVFGLYGQEKTVRTAEIFRAQQKIEQFKDSSVLLVRLSSRKASLEQLNAQGKHKIAIKLEAEQQQRNLKLVRSMRQHFTFCPVYFFYTEDSEFIRTDSLHHVHFLNDQLQIDTNIRLSRPHFFIAENAMLEEVFEEEKKSDQAGAKNTFYAFILKDQHFVQLAKPFPYFVKTMSNAPTSKEWDFAFKRLNQKLENFYKKTKEGTD